MENNKPIDIQDGKGADTIEHFFYNHVNPQVVKDISIDMSPSFISGCKKYFAWVEPTFDKWHIYKLLAKYLDTFAKKKTINYRLKEQITVLWEFLEEFYKSNNFTEAKYYLHSLLIMHRISLVKQIFKFNPKTFQRNFRTYSF